MSDEVKTQSMEFRTSFTVEFDVGIGTEPKELDVFITVEGIPAEIPEHMADDVDKTLQAAVRKKFTEIMGSSCFLEVYRRGHNRQNSSPEYINVSRVISFKIDSVEKL